MPETFKPKDPDAQPKDEPVTPAPIPAPSTDPKDPDKQG